MILAIIFHEKFALAGEFKYINCMNIDKFWERVRLQMKAHKITQKKFSEYLGVPYSTFNAWIYYKRSPEVFTAFDIASALGVSMEYLVIGEEGKKEKERMADTETRKTAQGEMIKLVGKLQDELVKL